MAKVTLEDGRCVMEQYPVLSEVVEVNGYHATVYSNGTIGSMTTNKDGSRMETPAELREHAEFLLVLARKVDDIRASEVYALSVFQCKRPKCSKVFLKNSSHTRRQYCSARCRQAEEKARQRSRKIGKEA